MKRTIILTALASLFFFSTGCTDLDTTVYSELTEINAYTDEETLLNGLAGVYNGLGVVTNSYFKVIVACSDEGICPSRGADWNSSDLRNLHTHNWSPVNGEINGAYENISISIANCNSFIESVEASGFSSDNVDVMIAEARFLRAFFYYLMCDNFGNVPITTSGLDDVVQSDRNEVFDFILSELNDVEDIIPETNDYGHVDRNAVWFLKAKLYLNAEVFTGTAMWNNALEQCNNIINAGTYQLYNEDNADASKQFLDIFAYNNGEGEKRVENIFAINFEASTDSWSKANFLQQYTLHYNQQRKYGLPESPWNGYATIRDAVERYEVTEGDEGVYTSNDQRFDAILTGQQYEGPKALTERDGATPLNFTLDFNSLENATESNGARVLKWVPAGTLVGHFMNNDFPVFRYADVLLMKAEILTRQNGGGTNNEALALINRIRRRSNATELAGATLDDILDERGREFLWELWRRNDQIRFGTFTTTTWDLKTNTGESYRRLFPIPTNQLNNNSNLEQNDGY
jgi:starch-binding outer membrane protein, SusD/RagB family